MDISFPYWRMSLQSAVKYHRIMCLHLFICIFRVLVIAIDVGIMRVHSHSLYCESTKKSMTIVLTNFMVVAKINYLHNYYFAWKYCGLIIFLKLGLIQAQQWVGLGLGGLVSPAHHYMKGRQCGLISSSGFICIREAVS